MTRHKGLEKILVIGPGPVIIGQGSEFDYSCVQACQALRSLGYQIVMVNSNPAAVTNDPEMADATYMEPLNLKVLEEIIDRERPQGLLANQGGQTALNLAVELQAAGVLDRYGVRVLGTGIEAIKACEEPQSFKETMTGLGLEVPEGWTVHSKAEAESAAEKLGYPVAVRAPYTQGGSGGGLASNVEELKEMTARCLDASPIGQTQVEASVLGWDELELEVVRDAENRMVTVCLIENIDAMGIHTGDSCCVSPMQTIDPDLQARLEEHAHAIAEKLDVVGGVNIQFAHDPDTDRVVVIEVNPRATRSSALASKATGFPMARVSALLAGGTGLDQIPYSVGGALDRYRPSNDRVAVKVPRWADLTLEGARDELGTQMRSVGEVMSFGRTFKEALQKAVCSLALDRYGLGFVKNFHELSLEDLQGMLGVAGSERLFQMYEALRKGADVQALARLTHIKAKIIEQLKELVDLEEEIRAYRGRMLPGELLERAKKDGFSDRYLANLLGCGEMDLRAQRRSQSLILAWESVSVCGSDGEYHYSTYNAPNRVLVGPRKKVMILGGGPNRIGQGAEFDHCCMQAASAVRQLGYEAIMVDCNPAAVATDTWGADKLYMEPLTVENVLAIYEKERPEGLLVQFGGKTALSIAGELASAGATLIGATPDMIDLAQNRERFRRMMRQLGIPQPESRLADSPEKALETAARIGYPVMLRPLGTHGRRRLDVVQDEKMFRQYLHQAGDVTAEQPIVIHRFLDNAIEAEVDAISDGQDAYVPAVMEHIELAGIHPGDSAGVIPPISIAPKHIETISEYTRKIAVALNVVGLMNVQFAIFENTVYVLEARPWAASTVPLVSRVCNTPLAGLAARLMLGENLDQVRPTWRHLLHFGVREAVFPFNMFPEIDPVLGLEMHSTGEVLGLSDNFGQSFFKAQEATPSPLPLEGAVLFTIADRDKTAAIEPVRLFRDLGFRIMTTKGTHEFLKKHRIDTDVVQKLEYGRPNLVDAMKNGKIQLMVNTPSDRESSIDTSEVRKTAMKLKIPFMTTTAAAIAAAKGIAARRKGAPKVRALQDYYQDIR